MSDDAMNDSRCDTRSIIKGGFPNNETAFVVEKDLRPFLELMSYSHT